jgi:predicted N-formylglutamate amidohydrolase
MKAAVLPPFDLVISAEHSSREIPEELGVLGLDPAVLDSHVAWDPGVDEVASYLAEHMDAPLFLGRYSRLVADLNRSPGTNEVVPEVAFGVAVPGNRGLSREERARRQELYHRPYWREVEGAIAARMPQTEDAPRLLHFSVHSFTPELDGNKRTLDLGILLDPDRPLEAMVSRRLVTELARMGFDTRENEPYDGRSDGMVTAFRRIFSPEAYAGVEVEINHRLLDDLHRVSEALLVSLRLIVGPGARARE